MVETEYDTCRNEQIHSKVMIALMGWLYGGLYKYMKVMGGNIVKVYVNIHIWYDVIPLISFDAWWKLSMVDVEMNKSIVKWWLHQWCSYVVDYIYIWLKWMWKSEKCLSNKSGKCGM